MLKGLPYDPLTQHYLQSYSVPVLKKLVAQAPALEESIKQQEKEEGKIRSGWTTDKHERNAWAVDEVRQCLAKLPVGWLVAKGQKIDLQLTSPERAEIGIIVKGAVISESRSGRRWYFSHLPKEDIAVPVIILVCFETDSEGDERSRLFFFHSEELRRRDNVAITVKKNPNFEYMWWDNEVDCEELLAKVRSLSLSAFEKGYRKELGDIS